MGKPLQRYGYIEDENGNWAPDPRWTIGSMLINPHIIKVESLTVPGRYFWKAMTDETDPIYCKSLQDATRYLGALDHLIAHEQVSDRIRSRYGYSRDEDG